MKQAVQTWWLDHLCMSEQAFLTLTRAEYRMVLLATGGTILRWGRLCNLKGKHLGAGIYRVTAEPSG